jgi:translin
VESLKAIADQIRVELDAKNSAREQALQLSREIIRLSANSIRAIHREEFDEAREGLNAAKSKVEETKNLLKNQLDIYYAGYVQDAQKEYAEGELTLRLVRDEPLLSDTELGVECAAYLNGLSEAASEGRRHALDLMRLGRLEQAERLLGGMDDAYYMLVTFDYPDAVTGGLRRTTDMLRGVVERTRGDLTVTLQQKRLEQKIEDAVNLLSDNG